MPYKHRFRGDIKDKLRWEVPRNQTGTRQTERTRKEVNLFVEAG